MAHISADDDHLEIFEIMYRRSTHAEKIEPKLLQRYGDSNHIPALECWYVQVALKKCFVWFINLLKEARVCFCRGQNCRDVCCLHSFPGKQIFSRRGFMQTSSKKVAALQEDLCDAT